MQSSGHGHIDNGLNAERKCLEISCSIAPSRITFVLEFRHAVM